MQPRHLVCLALGLEEGQDGLPRFGRAALSNRHIRELRNQIIARRLTGRRFRPFSGSDKHATPTLLTIDDQLRVGP